MIRFYFYKPVNYTIKELTNIIKKDCNNIISEYSSEKFQKSHKSSNYNKITKQAKEVILHLETTTNLRNTEKYITIEEFMKFVDDENKYYLKKGQLYERLGYSNNNIKISHHLNDCEMISFEHFNKFISDNEDLIEDTELLSNQLVEFKESFKTHWDNNPEGVSVILKDF